MVHRGNRPERGLPPARIREFQTFRVTEHETRHCRICIEDVEVGTIMMRLDCDGKHEFCKKCIEEWFKESTTCPLCRHQFDTRNVLGTYQEHTRNMDGTHQEHLNGDFADYDDRSYMNVAIPYYLNADVADQYINAVQNVGPGWTDGACYVLAMLLPAYSFISCIDNNINFIDYPSIFLVLLLCLVVILVIFTRDEA